MDESPMTIKDNLNFGRNYLSENGIDQAYLDARVLLEFVTKKSQEEILLNGEQNLEQHLQHQYKTLLARRAQREPLSHITCNREFYGLNFHVTNYTLDPRPDSEAIIDVAIALFPDSSAPINILDLGTGSGCLILSLLHHFKNANGVAVDISQDALEVAYFTARKQGTSDRITFVRQNWGTDLEGEFDLIVSNPPYIKDTEIENLAPEVARYEPRLALDGGADGLVCYHQLAPFIRELLAPNGYAVLEFGMGQEQDVAGIMQSNQLSVQGFKKDLAGITRVLWLQKT